ncbi:hypothetical protein FRC12_008877 [Ceratobasidium sp. 428]|nr:hypothetical protein FRC12_008877 [Ceratobasidium sp. 428]
MPVGRLELHPEERALRMHIQRQTLEYAQTYITTDHIWYTETGVAEIFSTSLNEIPLFAPTEVSFPIDPLDKLLGISNPEPYDEQFVLSAEDRDGARKVIAGHLVAFRGKGVESRCMNVMKTEDPNVLETPRRPLSPILTARARQETPKILHRSKAQIMGMLPTEMNESVDRARIHPVRVEDVLDEHIPEESLLDIQYTMPKEEVDEFRNLLMRVATNKTKQPPSGFADFLRTESPPPPPFFPRPMSPRLFPRAGTSKIGVDRTGLDNLAETIGEIGMERVEVEEGFGLEEIAQENMRMLGGGFDILPPSSPPPLSHDHTQFTSSDAAQPSSPPRTPRIHPSERAFEVSSSPSVHDIKLAKLGTHDGCFKLDEMADNAGMNRRDIVPK